MGGKNEWHSQSCRRNCTARNDLLLRKEQTIMILEALYGGEIHVEAQVVPNCQAYSDASKVASDLIKELEQIISKEAFEKVNELSDALSAVNGIEAIEQFKYGVAIGVLLMKEINELPYFPK